MQQWARVNFSHGVRTVPAGSMKFVDFSKPDPAGERVERFLVAAQRAMAEEEYELAAQRLIYARDAEPQNVAVLRLLTLAFWNAGKLQAAARAVHEWARADEDRPAAHRFAARIYEDIGAIDLAEEAAARAVKRGPTDMGAWERLGQAAPETAGSRGRDRSAGARGGAGRGGGVERSAGAGVGAGTADVGGASSLRTARSAGRCLAEHSSEFANPYRAIP